jgi:predicted anti-sigma-YlaC factor YlaD
LKKFLIGNICLLKSVLKLREAEKMFKFLRKKNRMGETYTTECEKTRSKLSEYLDDCLTPQERKDLEQHLEECEACRQEFELLRATVNLLHQVPQVPVPRSFALVEADLQRRKPSPLVLHFRWLQVATAVAVALLAFLLVADFSGFVRHPVEGPVIENHPTISGSIERHEPSQEEVSSWVRPLEATFGAVAVVLIVLLVLAIRERGKVKFRRQGPE